MNESNKELLINFLILFLIGFFSLIIISTINKFIYPTDINKYFFYISVILLITLGYVFSQKWYILPIGL